VLLLPWGNGPDGDPVTADQTLEDARTITAVHHLKAINPQIQVKADTLNSLQAPFN